MSYQVGQTRAHYQCLIRSSRDCFWGGCGSKSRIVGWEGGLFPCGGHSAGWEMRGPDPLEGQMDGRGGSPDPPGGHIGGWGGGQDHPCGRLGRGTKPQRYIHIKSVCGVQYAMCSVRLSGIRIHAVRGSLWQSAQLCAAVRTTVCGSVRQCASVRQYARQCMAVQQCDSVRLSGSTRSCVRLPRSREHVVT